MLNPDDITNEKNDVHNPKWLYIPDHPCGMLIIGGAASGKANTLLDLMKE